MKIYISGSISNNKNYLKDFEKAENFLKKMYPRYEIINPAKILKELPESTKYEEYMQLSFLLLKMADGIFMVPGWENSKGANQEYGYARGQHMIFFDGNRIEFDKKFGPVYP